MAPDLGRFLILFGGLMILVGIVLSLNIQIPWIGRLPGDILIKKDNFTFYFPLTTCILLSVVFTLILAFFRR